MDTFGQTLKSEREDRGLTIEAIAEMLAVDQDLLSALERNDFELLPDDATMLATLQGYARCLEVDAEMMIDHYVKERARCLQHLADRVAQPAVAELPAAEPQPIIDEAPAESLPVADVAPAVAEPAVEIVPEPVATIRESRPPLAAVVAVCVVLAAGAVFTAWWMFAGDASGANAPAATQPTSSASPAEAIPTPTKQPVRRSAVTTAVPPTLGIPEFGVGTGIKGRQLVGQRNDFAEGSKVWFWTHVEGGSAGGRIEHVWFQDGEVALRVSLKLGGSRWRTFSNKMMHAGAAGDWAVEARDSKGRVLARSEFSCSR